MGGERGSIHYEIAGCDAAINEVDLKWISFPEWRFS